MENVYSIIPAYHRLAPVFYLFKILNRLPVIVKSRQFYNEIFRQNPRLLYNPGKKLAALVKYVVRNEPLLQHHLTLFLSVIIKDDELDGKPKPGLRPLPFGLALTASAVNSISFNSRFSTLRHSAVKLLQYNCA